MDTIQTKALHDAQRLVRRYPTQYSLGEYNTNYEHRFTLTRTYDYSIIGTLVIRTQDWRLDYNIDHFINTVSDLLKRGPASPDEKWNARFLKLAQTVAGYSKDPSTKVGAVIVDDDDNVRTIGYNGFPRGVKDTEERLNDRSIKYPLTVHAELNAICTCARVGVPTKGATMVCTHFPCADCAGAIVQAGFKEVVVLSPTEDFDSRWKETNALALTIFIEGKVDVVVFTEDELKEDENVT